MSAENENKKGCTTITILFSILVIGLIVRLFVDTEGLFQDIMGVFIGILVIFTFVQISRRI